MERDGNLPVLDVVVLETSTKTPSPRWESHGTVLVKWLRSWVLEQHCPTEVSVVMTRFYSYHIMAATSRHVTTERAPEMWLVQLRDWIFHLF